jgi:hypothetical protein
MTAGLCVPSDVSAQTTTETGLSPRQLFIRMTSSAAISNIGEVMADLVGLEVSTAPLGSSAGGFTFTFDPITRAFNRAAPSFGPMFGERAITAGEGRANFGINYIRRSYDALEGVDIGGGDLRTMSLEMTAGPLIRGTADLKIQTDTMVLFANVALNNRFDLGVAVPYVAMRMTGRHQTFNLARNLVEEEISGSVDHRGLGDVAIRGKLRLYAREQGGLAVGVDARLPTADKEALLGAGVTRTAISGIWSDTFGRFAPHASAGFEYWAQPFQIFDPVQQSGVDAGQHAIVYSGGVEWAASDRLTVNGEFTGRDVKDGGRLAYRDVAYGPNPFGITRFSLASVSPAGLRQLSAGAGVKWNFAGAALLNANILFPLDDTGLRDSMTPVIGLDWGF